MNDFETKQAIVDALKKFQSSPLGEAASGLLGALGYTSKKRLALKPNTLATFLATFSQGRSLNERYALPNEWKSVDFLFQLTDEEIRSAANMQFEFESKGAFNGAIINSYLFIAIELKQEHYSRSVLAGITREVNKLFQPPALIFYRHGETITLAVINHRLHKREPGKDVLEKVTLIQDIRLTNTHRAHIEILSDLSLSVLHQKHPFTNFVGLHEAWQKTLDTSELNKRFFQDLANWYFWALPQVRFPKNAPKDADGQDSLSLIRLITRVIFCWFLKEKGLLPSALFDDHKITELLTDLNPKDSTYYKAILQNLFFATLNQEMGKREFRKTGQNFMAHNVYRYRSLLKSPNDLLTLLSQIPFMNGGLFECLDKTLGTKESPHYVRIDGFSDRDDNALKIPNSLFWGPEKVVDLSEAYGENKYSASRVAGLVRIFDRYKFTVAENTPLDEEIALDPELLGKVFENLLAAYNPETGATARKQTGSFYTPREIVNYMVDESLIFSLCTRLKNALPKAAQVEERLRQLMAYSDAPHQFADHEVTALIYAIDHLKILDPACGSGAFPMGILHKLVYVLAKLDPGNQRWKARQLAKANEIPDSTVRERVVFDIEQSFNANELDYGRKLYLIENCIYGVDIQPIAVQISKLRFFISLVVEQNANSQSENCGIRPLPNLETKFVAANTLIGIDRPRQQLLRNPEIDAREEELRSVRERHFLARTPATKGKCREQDAKLRADIAEMLRLDGWDSPTARMLAAWDPYDQNATAPFFDSEWMFGIAEGFDVVIGNPPYVKEDVNRHAFDGLRDTDCYQGKMDLWYLFGWKGLNIIKQAGVLCFIAINNWVSNDGASKFRDKVIREGRILKYVDFGNFKIFSAGVQTMVFLIAKATQPTSYTITYSKLLNDQASSQMLTNFLAGAEAASSDEFIRHCLTFDRQKTLGHYITFVPPTLARVVDKILSSSTTYLKDDEIFSGIDVMQDFVSKNHLGTLGNAHAVGEGIFVISEEEKNSLKLTADELSLLRPYYTTREIGRYYASPGNRYWIIYAGKDLNKKIGRYPNIKRHLDQYQDVITSVNKPYGLHRTRDEQNFIGDKLLSIRKCSRPSVAMVTFPCYVSRAFLVIKTARIDMKWLLAFLNSRLAEFWLAHKGKRQGNNYQVDKEPLLNIPIKIPSKSDMVHIAKCVDELLAMTSPGATADSKPMEMQLCERQIDRLVYGIFGLTADEIEIVEGNAK